MDNKKDNKLQSLHYNYNKGVEFDINTVGPFGDNYACAHAYKKTEKLLIALYLVTNFVPEKEPAKNIIRDKSIRVLSDILGLRAGFKSTGSEQVDLIVASLYEIISLLDILHVAGFVSNMNLEILKKEFSKLIIFLREVDDTKTSEKITFDSNDFKIDESTKGQSLIDNIVSFNKKDTIKKTQMKNKRQNRKNNSQSQTVLHSERIDTILNIIKNKGSVNIKDISATITGCSEKTIQRELISLVQNGVLKKEGERRWSTYSLVI